MKGTTTELISPRSTVRPQFIYNCERFSNKLNRVNLLTGEQSCLKIKTYRFNEYCCWSELPGGTLFITGGHSSVRDVVRIDTLREWAVSSQPPMHTGKQGHAAVYYSQYLYVLGGYRRDSYLSECERYSCAESRWEVLPDLPIAGWGMSAVEVDNSLYALGGKTSRKLDLVQKFSLDSLTWTLMQLKLPQAARVFPCFKADTQVYLVIKKTLYSFTPLKIEAVKTLPRRIDWCRSSYYGRGTLYHACSKGMFSLALGI
jgi:hypothetical protein